MSLYEYIMVAKKMLLISLPKKDKDKKQLTPSSSSKQVPM